MGARVLVCGGRLYSKRDVVFAVLNRIHDNKKISCIIHGTAKGADTLGAQWASKNNIPDDPYPPKWKVYRNAAGPIRNQQMLEEGKPDLVVAFAGGSGTQHMKEISLKKGVPVLAVSEGSIKFKKIENPGRVVIIKNLLTRKKTYLILDIDMNLSLELFKDEPLITETSLHVHPRKSP